MKKDNMGVMYTVFICLGLIALILWMFFMVVFGEKRPVSQMEISVILYSAGTGGWQSFQEGIKQAEDDFPANINLVILPEDADAEEQLKIMKREIENGAEGLALAVDDYEKLYELMLREDFKVPIVTVESGLDEPMFPLISADNYEMGKMLGEEILKDFSDETELTIALAANSTKRSSVKQRENGLLDALEGKAKIIPLRAAVNGQRADAAVALYKEALYELAEQTAPSLNRTKKYGIGNTASIVAALDQGRIEKLVFQNEFNIGYLAIETLMGSVGSIPEDEDRVVEFYCVSSKELYGTQYERLLFPIVE